MISPDLVEGVLEVDLEERQVRVLVLVEGVSQRMCDHLDSSLASDPIVPSLECVVDVILARDAETFAHEASDWTRGRTAVAVFCKAIDTPPARMVFKKSGAAPLASRFTSRARIRRRFLYPLASPVAARRACSPASLPGRRC